jgi:hypothetical protein
MLMNSKTGLALSVIGIAAVLMLVLAPITANHQTFAYKYYYGKHYYHGKYYYGKYYKRCYYRYGHRVCVIRR